MKIRDSSSLFYLEILRGYVNSYDWSGIPASSIEGIVLEKAHPGAVILLHDGKNSKQRHDRSQTVQALPAIINSGGFV